MEEKITHIEGTVEDVLFKNESNGYIVLDLDSGENLITVVGELGEIEKGEHLVVEGEYKIHPKFGTQFYAEYCERKLPSDTINIEKYLASRIIKGIGPSLAKRIVSVFGDKTLEIIEKEPDRLSRIKGISVKKCNEIKAESKKLFALRGVISYLSQYGVKSGFAVKAYQKFGEDTVEVIKNNPYILCSADIELDFKKADMIASEQNMKKNDVKRIISGIQYILDTNIALGGHSCLPLDRLCEKTQLILDISEIDFYDAYNKALEESELFEYIKNEREFVYLSDYYYAERFIADRLKILRDFDKSEEYDYEALIDIEEDEGKIKYENLQRKAIKTAVSNSLMVMTGGPGTGKTTSVNAIISILEKMEYNVMLAAPTGRAAKRLSELTNHEAKTIHRLLEVGFDENGKLKFIHNETNPLSCDAIIIDEMSMVDVILFSSLLTALPLDCKIIMVGDSNQLPAVGAGNLLKDIIESGIIPVIELKEIFRQAKSSFIITNAHKIVNGEYPDLSQKKNDFFFFKRTENEAVLKLIVDLVKIRLPKAYNYSYLEDIQILTPSRKGVLGTIEINKLLQQQLNPPSPKKSEVKSLIYTFREGDKIMQTKNNYDIVWEKNDETGSGIYNGDIGKILKINAGEVFIDFDGKIAVYTFELMSQLELAYAITVHKSQGCEFETVIMPILDGFEKLYYRNLLYTAVTRAKKLMILIGSEEKIKSMVDNNRKTFRYTCLPYMLREIQKEDFE